MVGHLCNKIHMLKTFKVIRTRADKFSKKNGHFKTHPYTQKANKKKKKKPSILFNGSSPPPSSFYLLCSVSFGRWSFSTISTIFYHGNMLSSITLYVRYTHFSNMCSFFLVFFEQVFVQNYLP